jgi:hypothetical protein
MSNSEDKQFIKIIKKWSSRTPKRKDEITISLPEFTLSNASDAEVVNTTLTAVGEIILGSIEYLIAMALERVESPIERIMFLSLFVYSFHKTDRVYVVTWYPTRAFRGD